MAQRVVLSDDLDGSEAAETITYTINGQDYEIDLSEENAQLFCDAFDQYISACRQVSRQAAPARRGRGDGRRRSSSRRDDIPAIRAWAETDIAVDL